MDHTEPIRVHIETSHVLSLTASNAADVKLIERLGEILNDGDRSVVLTTLIELWDRHRSRKRVHENVQHP